MEFCINIIMDPSQILSLFPAELIFISKLVTTANPARLKHTMVSTRAFQNTAKCTFIQ